MKTSWYYRSTLILFTLISCFIPSGCNQHISTKQDQPNVVLIIIDTLRRDKLGCNGFPEAISPVIDQISRKGLLFSNVISQCSWTRPSIGSMLTSVYPRTLGLYKEENEILRDRFETLSKILKKQNYHTLGLTANPHLNKVYNFHKGFDLYAESQAVFDFGQPEKNKVVYPRLLFPVAKDVFGRALSWVTSDNKTPCYIQINVMDVHESGRAVRDFNLLRYYDVRNNPFGIYWAAVRQVANETETFLTRLLALPGWDNTIVVITSDHGEGLGDHPHVPESMYHGHYLYESQLNVPLIIFNPSWHRSGKIISQRVRLLELVPTLCDMLHIPLQDSFQGRSMMPLINRTSDHLALPDFFVSETYFKGSNKISVYSDDWKYIENRDGQKGVNPEELQPMYTKEDGIRTDQIAVEGQIAKEMKQFLQNWESAHPKNKSTPCRKTVSPEVVEQLKSMGYLN